VQARPFTVRPQSGHAATINQIPMDAPVTAKPSAGSLINSSLDVGSTTASSVSSAYVISEELRTRIERRRFRGKWADVKGIAEDNARIVKDGGFTLGSGSAAVELGQLPPSVLFDSTKIAAASDKRRFVSSTEFCVANVDTLTAALALGDACALNHANAEIPGGRYTHGGKAQEEDLCRCLPQLWPSLSQSGLYPIPPHACLITRELLACRQPGTYERCEPLGKLSILTAAMPNGVGDKRPKGGWLGSPWADDVRERIKIVLYAAQASGHANLVIGAWGCGAFGNPTIPVASLFREQLMSDAFRGSFEKVVIAILDPLGTGNLAPFVKEFKGGL
jgi:hypothetical protein